MAEQRLYLVPGRAGIAPGVDLRAKAGPRKVLAQTPEAGGQRPEAGGDWCSIVRRTGYNWAWAELEATPTAMRGLAWLESTGLDWDAIVGPTCMAMLRSGWTLELEGATNPHIYTEDFTRRQSKRLFG